MGPRGLKGAFSETRAIHSGEKHVLLVVATNLHATIGPGDPEVAADRGVVVVVTGVAALNGRVWLLGLRADDVADGLISTPAQSVVRGSDQPKLVAVVSGVAPVVPRGDQVSLWSGGQGRHPLRTVSTRRPVPINANARPPRAPLSTAPHVPLLPPLPPLFPPPSPA